MVNRKRKGFYLYFTIYTVTYSHVIIVDLYILLGNVGYGHSAVLLWGPKGGNVADFAVDGDPVTCARTSG